MTEREAIKQRKSRRIKVCKHCGRSVRETVYNAGYCLKCISLARLEARR